MKKNKFFNSIFWKISAIFLLTLLLLSAVYIYIAVWTAEMYYQEATQRLNLDVAAHIAAEHQCFTNGEISKDLEKVFRDMTGINPSIEIYLLNTQGRILSRYPANKEIKLQQVPVEPVKELIKNRGSHFVLSVDPKDGNPHKGFSAAEVYEGSVLRGYLYVILGSEEYVNAAQFVFGSYMLRLGVRSMAITFVAAALISLLAVGLITRNLRKIIYVIRKFKDGKLDSRIDLKGRGELKEFADSFNDMADTIVRNYEEIKMMDNLRRELVANVSHDLRTPLATIQGYIETILIKADTLTEEDRVKYTHTILSSTERLKNLVEELFELSKLEAREKVPHPEPFSIAELVQDVRQKNMIIAENRQIDLIVQFPYDLPLVFADIAMMERVIQNLLDNAFKFTPEGGSIKISLTGLKDYVQLSVEDTGSGINSSDLPYIFDRFQKAKRINVKDNLGLGLGLTIVKKILEVHNIPIDVKSSEWKGTVFSFNIPLFGKVSKLSAHKWIDG